MDGSGQRKQDRWWDSAGSWSYYTPSSVHNRSLTQPCHILSLNEPCDILFLGYKSLWVALMRYFTVLSHIIIVIILHHASLYLH